MPGKERYSNQLAKLDQDPRQGTVVQHLLTGIF